MYCKHCGKELNTEAKFCKECGTGTSTHKPTKAYFSWNKKYKGALIAVGAVLAGGALLFFLVPESGISDAGYSSLLEELIAASSDKPTTSFAGKNFPVREKQTLADSIASSVVDILCDDGENGSGGSGTVVDKDGVILTNAHIIPQDKEGSATVDSCIVTFPNPQTGKIDQMYSARPFLVPGLGQQYDLAFFFIDGPYVDGNGKSYGVATDTYPAFDGCENNNPTLGEFVRVYGYPEISAGGWYLTVTEGVVSALPNDGTIVTSAKVSHGNSGGLAVDEDGCTLGVPSMISSDGDESLGVIISNDVVHQFMGDLNSALDEINSN